MKKFIDSLMMLTVMLCSCKKEHTETTVQIPEDKGCIEWKKVLVTEHSGHSINNSNIPIINDLFANNNIDQSKYRYYYYAHDSVQTYFPPYEKFDQKIIRVKEFTNGLEIFTGEILFVFKNNIFNYRNGDPSGGSTLSTTPRLSAGQIRTLFIGSIEQFDHNGNQYKDSCFSAEFGYYNLSSGASPKMPENLTKAWKVTLKNKIYPSEYPIAYYQDNDGKLIYYSNGVVSGR